MESQGRGRPRVRRDEPEVVPSRGVLHGVVDLRVERAGKGVPEGEGRFGHWRRHGDGAHVAVFGDGFGCLSVKGIGAGERAGQLEAHARAGAVLFENPRGRGKDAALRGFEITAHVGVLGDNRQDARGVVREARAAHCRDGPRAADVRETLLPHAVRELDAQPDGGKNHDLHGRETVEDRCDGAHGKGIAQGQPGAAVAPASYACAVLGGSEGRGENREDEEPGHGHGAAGVQDVHEIEDERAHDAVSWRAGGEGSEAVPAGAEYTCQKLRRDVVLKRSGGKERIGHTASLGKRLFTERAARTPCL